MTTVLNDIKYGFRMLWKYSGGTIVIVCTLGLVIGTLSLALGAIQHERTAWLPFPEADRLVRLWRIGMERPREGFPAAVYGDACQHLQGLESVAALGMHESYVMTGGGEPRSLSGLRVSASAFEVADIQPLLGRSFSREEERTGEKRLVVLSYETWQTVFDGTESVIGDSIRLNEEPHIVVGVMPKGYERNALFYGNDIWLPGNFSSPAHADNWIQIIGRRKQGITQSQLRAELGSVILPVLKTYYQAKGGTVSVGSVNAFPVDRQFSNVEAGAVVFVAIIPLFILLIACFNIANILLARMAARRKEIAVRSSLGAGRWRLIRQLLTENVLLALCGGLVGLLGAVWISGWAAARGLPSQFSVAVLGGVSAATLLIGMAIGFLPAWRATRGDLVDDLKEGGGSASGGVKRHRLRSFLVAGQVAMATVLCISAGLLVRTYLNKKGFDPGFETKNLVSVSVFLRPPAYEKSERRLLFCEQALEQIRTVAGVEEVGVCSTAEINRGVFPMGFLLEGDVGQWKPGQMVNLSIVSPNYLEMVNVPVLRGRALTAADRRGSDPVALVNQSFIRQYFPQTDPIGRRFGLNIEQRKWFTIVGVVPDRRNLGFRREDLGAEAYLSHQQVAPSWAQYFFLARAKATPGLFGAAIRRAVQSIDNNQPVSSPFTTESQMQWLIQKDIKGTQAITAVGMSGLIMALLGIYGVVSNSVVERTHELGIRLALGAGEGEILRFIIKRAMKLTLLGLGVGAVLAVGATFGLSGLLFGVNSLDVSTYLWVSLIFVGTALAASLVPARRAAKVGPMMALRYE